MSDLLPPEDRREGHRRAVDGLLRTMLGERRAEAGDRALALLRAERQQRSADPQQIGTAQIRAATARASQRARPGSGTHRRSARGSARGTRRTSMIQGAWAAATLVTVVLVLVLAGRSSAVTEDLRVVTVGGTVIAGQGDHFVPLREDMVVTRGDVLTTGANSFVRLLWNDGTLLECAADSRVQIEREGAGKRLRLVSGRLDAMVAPQPLEAPFRIMSDDAEVTVVGTRLSCTHRLDGMQVAVTAGRVSVQRLLDDAVVDVVAGQQLAVVARGPLTPEQTPVIAATSTTPVGTGLFGQYFDDADLKIPVFSRVDREIYFNFGWDSSPDPRIAPSTFSIRWTADLQPKVSGRHVFSCQVDDGVRIRLDGKLILQDWRVFEPRWLRVEVDLDASRRHRLEVEYYQDRERAIIQLWWQAKGVPQEVIPTANLFPVRPAGALNE